VHNTQENKTIDFDELDFLSQDNIFKKPIWIFFSRVNSTTPRCHSSFYRVLLSLVVRHFWVSVILNSFIITCVVHHFNCPESKIRGHLVFGPSVCLCQRLGRGHQCFTNASCSVLKSFCIRHFVFLNFAVWVGVCKLYDDILYILDWTEE
jgi:hypothetical protein